MDKFGVVFSQYCISTGLLCVLLYMYGFFPIKTSSSVFSSQFDFPSSLQDIKWVYIYRHCTCIFLCIVDWYKIKIKTHTVYKKTTSTGVNYEIVCVSQVSFLSTKKLWNLFSTKAAKLCFVYCIPKNSYLIQIKLFY